jgi:translocation and assembly module TamA
MAFWWIMPLALASSSLLADPAQLQPEIRLEGVTGRLLRNVRAHLSLLEETCTSPRWRIQNAFAASESEIRKALRALGYYQPTIARQLEFTQECWRASFTIAPGARVRLAEVEVKIEGEAAEDPTFQALYADLPLKPGGFLHHGRYEELKQRLLNLAESQGYFDARLVKHELIVDPAQGLAWVRLYLESGRRYAIGRIELEQDFLDPDFVRRYLPFRVGDPYSSTALTLGYQTLADSGYFEDVEVRALREQLENLQIPVSVRLRAKKRHFFKAGLGFDTNTGPRALLGYENRRLNRRGHRLEFGGRISPVRSELDSAYLIPWTHPAQETLSLKLGYLHEQTDTSRTDSVGIGARFLHPRWSVKEILGADLKYESSGVHRAEEQAALLLVPQIQWTYTQADEILRPKRGFKADLTLKGGSSLAGDPVRFLQARACSKGISSLPWQGRLLSRIELGATLTDHFANLPATYRFFAGGDTSIRGYGYQRLGPKNRDGEVIGGRYLGVLSLEVEQALWQHFGAAVFADAGNAFLRFSEPIQVGAGVGVRWYSPIGPLRLDFAIPVSKPELGFRIHVSMGPEL